MATFINMQKPEPSHYQKQFELVFHAVNKMNLSSQRGPGTWLVYGMFPYINLAYKLRLRGKDDLDLVQLDKDVWEKFGGDEITIACGLERFHFKKEHIRSQKSGGVQYVKVKAFDTSKTKYKPADEAKNLAIDAFICELLKENIVKQISQVEEAKSVAMDLAIYYTSMAKTMKTRYKVEWVKKGEPFKLEGNNTTLVDDGHLGSFCKNIVESGGIVTTISKFDKRYKPEPAPEPKESKPEPETEPKKMPTAYSELREMLCKEVDKINSQIRHNSPGQWAVGGSYPHINLFYSKPIRRSQYGFFTIDTSNPWNEFGGNKLIALCGLDRFKWDSFSGKDEERIFNIQWIKNEEAEETKEPEKEVGPISHNSLFINALIEQFNSKRFHSKTKYNHQIEDFVRIVYNIYYKKCIADGIKPVRYEKWINLT